MNNNINFPNQNNINVNQKLYLGHGTYGVVFKSGTGKFVKKITLWNYEDQENINKIINIRDILTDKYKNKTYKYFIIPYKVDTLISYQELSNKIKTTQNKNQILQHVRHMYYTRNDIFNKIKQMDKYLIHVYQTRNKNKINKLSKIFGKPISFNGLNNKDIRSLIDKLANDYENYLKQTVLEQSFAVEYSHFWPNSQDLFTIKSLTEENCTFIIKTLIQEVKMLHECNIFHNDLKPENIVVSFENEKWYPRILDFGLSMIINKNHPHLTNMVMFGTFAILPTEFNQKPQRMTQIIKKYHRFPISENEINQFNDFLISQWNNVLINKNNKVHQKEITKKILFYTDIFCLTLCFQDCLSKVKDIKPYWIEFLNYCCGAKTPNHILSINDIENKFKEMSRNNK